MNKNRKARLLTSNFGHFERIERNVNDVIGKGFIEQFDTFDCIPDHNFRARVQTHQLIAFVFQTERPFYVLKDKVIDSGKR